MALKETKISLTRLTKKKQKSHDHLSWALQVVSAGQVLGMGYQSSKTSSKAIERHASVSLFYSFVFSFGGINKAAVRSCIAFPSSASQNPPLLASVSGFNFEQILFYWNLAWGKIQARKPQAKEISVSQYSVYENSWVL